MHFFIPYQHLLLLTLFLCLFVLGVLFTLVWCLRRRKFSNSVWLLIACAVFVVTTVAAAT
ncbi:hypothetical protein [Alicyclobacillus fodiniaquatilis]|jgi:hypothetical protein|uniref:Uncharacterized protein n=1 Tax=Alicyclobacillus fodiniaquatilis TaxID=1661150 RepID=A0ABW4JB96_9BACL